MQKTSVTLKITCGKTNMSSHTGGAKGTIEVAGDQIEAVDRFTYCAEEQKLNQWRDGSEGRNGLGHILRKAEDNIARDEW